MNVSDKDVGEKWLFLFCFCVGLCVSSKTKCATCVAAVKLKNKKCAVAKNKNSLHLLVGLAVNRSRMLSKNVGVMSVCLMLVMSSNRVSGNADICAISFKSLLIIKLTQFQTLINTSNRLHSLISHTRYKQNSNSKIFHKKKVN